MFNKIINSYGLFYPKRQKLWYYPKTKTLGETYLEIAKEKRNFFFKQYKKLLKFKSNKQTKLRLKPDNFLLDNKVLDLNLNLTKIPPYCNLNLLSKHGFYQNLRKTKSKVKKLKGYSQYYDKVFH